MKFAFIIVFVNDFVRTLILDTYMPPPLNLTFILYSPTLTFLTFAIIPRRLLQNGVFGPVFHQGGFFSICVKYQ